MADDRVVCMTYSTDLAAEEFTYQVTVDDDVIEGDVLRNRLTHTVDNPGAEPVQVSSFTQVVEGAAAPAVRVVPTRDAREPRRDGIVTFKRPASAVGEQLAVAYDVSGTAERGVDYRGLDRRGHVRARRPRRAGAGPGHQPAGPAGRTHGPVTLAAGEGYSVGEPSVARVKIRDARRSRR